MKMIITSGLMAALATFGAEMKVRLIAAASFASAAMAKLLSASEPEPSIKPINTTPRSIFETRRMGQA